MCHLSTIATQFVLLLLHCFLFRLFAAILSQLQVWWSYVVPFLNFWMKHFCISCFLVVCIRRRFYQAACWLRGGLQRLEAVWERTCLQSVLHEVWPTQRVLGDDGQVRGFLAPTVTQQCSVAIDPVCYRCRCYRFVGWCGWWRSQHSHFGTLQNVCSSIHRFAFVF